MTIATLAEYQRDWDKAKRDPDAFWLAVANERISWDKAPTVGLEGSFATIDKAPLKWFSDGTLNASVIETQRIAEIVAYSSRHAHIRRVTSGVRTSLIE